MANRKNKPLRLRSARHARPNVAEENEPLPFELRGYVGLVKKRMHEKLDGLPEIANNRSFTERLITDDGFLAQQFVEYMRYDAMRKPRKAKRARKR